ncbi:MAG: hypothetical protein PHU14_03190 [Methylovulum sp.]|nr:hypothetical protein [Methylovulum sp.]
MGVLPSHRFICCLLASLVLAACAGQASKEDNITKTSPAEVANVLPAGVTELSLTEFYQFPVGPLGLKPTAKLLGLNNKRVRLSGYMIKEEEPTIGLFMLAPLPVSLAEKEDGPADDLPAATVFVHVPPADKDKVVSYRPGLWQLTGTLKLGNQEEANGRMSYTRLILD